MQVIPQEPADGTGNAMRFRRLKEGGVLVYATCSFFKRENEQVVTEFLAAHPEFELEPYAHPLTGTPTPGMLQIWPWDGDCDAMFTVRMRKRAHAGSS